MASPASAPAPIRLPQPLVKQLIIDLIQTTFPRFRSFPRPKGERLRDDWHLDSMEIMEIAARLHGMFHLMDSPTPAGYLLNTDHLDTWAERIHLYHQDLLSFTSSGSTGAPLTSVHAISQLQQEVAEIARLASPLRRLFVQVPVHHIYGFLFGVLLPAQAQVPVFYPHQVTPDQYPAHLQEGDWVVGHPFWWKFWQDSGFKLSTPAGAFTSTAPMPPALGQTLQQAGWRFMEIYGSTETSGIGFRLQAADPFSLFSFWEKKTAHTLQRKGAAAETNFPDEIEWQDGRQFRVLRRQDTAVQVGGRNVYPEQIARLFLAAFPQLTACTLRKASPEAGEKLKMVAVSQTDQALHAAALQAKLFAWARAHLPPEAVPAWIEIRDELPRNAYGKQTDW